MVRLRLSRHKTGPTNEGSSERHGGKKERTWLFGIVLVLLVRHTLLTTNDTLTTKSYRRIPNWIHEPLSSSSITSGNSNIPSSDQVAVGPMSSWPGVARHELSENPAEMKLIRIGRDRGPVEDARDFLLEHLDDFLTIYKNRPDKSNLCGIRISHSLAVYTIAKRLQPSTIIESGVNSGQSTYFFRQACPTAKIISIDPLDKPICGQPVRWIDHTNNEYLTGESFIDFDAVNWQERIQSGEIDPQRTLVFIDDHMGFFKRFPTFVKAGFVHVINEDNYIQGEGSTRWDKAGLTPKQMFQNPLSADTEWLYYNLKRYAEFPPILPPSMNLHYPRKPQGGFLHPEDDLERIEEPLLRPDVNETHRDIFHKMAAELGLDATLKENESYQHFMGYCYLCYLELVQLAPALKKNWGIA